MSLMTPTRGRTRRRTGARRNERPQPCQRCTVPIVFGRQLQDDGSILMHSGGPKAGRPHLVVLTAEPSPRGEWLFVRGSVGSPVVRYLDGDFERLTADGVRYREHKDTVRSER